MRVYAVDLGGHGDPHVVEYEGPTDGCELDSILYISAPRRISVRELDSQLKALDAKWLRAGQLIVLRLHPPVAAELLADEVAIDILRRRLEGLPLLVARLAPDRSIQLAPVFPLEESGAPVHEPEQILEAVRFAELHGWLEQPGVVLPANDDFHYEGPNGCRYESFMRVGTAIQGMETLDAVSFWLQPHLQGSPVVVLDAWTINSVALNLSRYAHHCGAPCEPAPDIECLGAYDEDMDKLRLRLAAIQRRSQPGTPALLVSSVVSLGNLHRRLESLIAEVGFDEVRSLALYGHAESEGSVFCRPAAVGRYWRKDEECPLKTPTVPIAPSTYLPEVAIKPSRARIREPNARQASEFFDSYGGGDFLTVHRDEPDRKRHHMIHVDVERLMRQPRFSERLGEELEPLSPDVILAPPHAAAAALAREAAQRLGVEPPILVDAGGLPRLDDDDQRKLRDAGDILIVDDVVIDGSPLLGYRNFLRRCGHVSEERLSNVHLLAGVARVPDYLTIVGIEDMVDSRDRFHPVETLLLPDWGRLECPWCWELRRLEEVGHALQQTEKLSERWRRLRDSHHGLRDSLFIPWLSEEPDPLPVSVWKLGPKSIFRAKTEIDLFVAVASAVQSLRAAGDLTERHMYPLDHVLDPRFWLSGRYYDAVIVAAILRATRRHDVKTTQIELELLRGMSSRLRNHDDLRGELLLAMARRHLPIDPEITADHSLLGDPLADPGFSGLMRGALEDPVTRP